MVVATGKVALVAGATLQQGGAQLAGAMQQGGNLAIEAAHYGG